MSKEENNEDIPESEPLKTKQANKDEFENRTFLQKINYIKSNITVEPVLAGLIVPSMLSRLAIQNLNIDKACRVKLGFGDEICDALIDKNGTNLSEYEKEAQKIISSIEAWRSIIQTALPTILVIFMGAWSDRTGNRKMCILLPLIGEFLTCIVNIISTYFFYEIPVEATMFLEVIFPACAGGWVMVYLGVFSYISDITSAETRTFRVGLVNLCMTAGVPIGTALSGILLKYLGYYGVFAISGTIYFITLIYGLFYLEANTKRNAEITEKDSSSCAGIVDLVKDTVLVAFKKRAGNLRTMIILTLTVVAIIYGPNHGERIVLYLYVRYRLKWDAVKYSAYSTFNIITHSIGALFSISVFSRRLGFPDALLCLISVTSKLAGSILLANATTDLHMYMIPLVEILNSTTFTSLRSMASKLVPSEELGKMNSLFSLVETLAALMFDPAYSTLYWATIQPMPGAVFIFSAVMVVPAAIILIWFLLQYKREMKNRIKKGSNLDIKVMDTEKSSHSN